MNPPLMTREGSIINRSCVRVLIVDDEPDGARSLGMLLKMRGYSVEVVIDSQLCVSRLASFKPDVVLLDIAMPNVSGYDLARQMRAHPAFERIAIIALSGYGDPQHTEQSFEAGCDQHLVKPATCDKLDDAIAHEVKKREQPGN